MPNINGRLLKIYGFTPAEQMMGYNPEWTVFEQPPAANLSETAEANEVLEATQEVLQYWVEKRQELRSWSVCDNTLRISSRRSPSSLLPNQHQRNLIRNRDLGNKDKNQWSIM